MRAGKCHEREDENTVSDVAEEIAEPEADGESAQNAALPQRLRLRASRALPSAKPAKTAPAKT